MKDAKFSNGKNVPVMIMGFSISSIVRSISSLGILKSLGMSNNLIGKFYFLNSLFIALLGFLVSFLFFKILIFLDFNYGLMNYFFPDDIYYDFSFKLENFVILKIFLLNIGLVALSALYPMYKIKKLNLIDAVRSVD